MGVTLDGFEVETFTALGETRDVYRRGTGPAVVVVHEIPGITPLVAEFGREVADAGFTAVLPSLFGTPGKPLSFTYAAGEFFKACISREFATLALDRTSPITAWLRELARAEHARCGGPGVGALGMCLTGGFALAMTLDDAVVAPVLSQPSLPLPFGRARKAAVGLSDADFERVKARVAAGTCVLGLRFEGDKASPAARFATLRRELGDNFVGVELPGSKHSVLTVDRDAGAVQQVLDFFRDRLLRP